MPITPLATPCWLFVPPLELPLTLRIENGRFGALRPKPLPQPPPCATTQFIPADDPRNPSGGDLYVANQIHEAVDLAAAADDCVFAAYSGRVVDVEAAAVTIDHHPQGLGFVTKYIHIDHIAVAPGDFVQKGMPFAAVSTEPTEPHLHFELWAVVDSASAGAPGWPGDTDLVPLDPTRALYAWEQRTLADEAFTDGPLAPQSIGLVACTRFRSSPRRSRTPSCTCPCITRRRRTNGSRSTCCGTPTTGTSTSHCARAHPPSGASTS